MISDKIAFGAGCFERQTIVLCQFGR